MILRDPVHGDINIEDELILDLIFTKEFQRLRQIKQLGLSYLLFPGAEHSRYTHSIGVYFLAGVFIDSIEKNCNYRFTTKQKKCLKVAALLHDIGHGALSHTAEEMFDKSHEVYSSLIIKTNTTEVNKVLKKHMPNGIKDVIAIIEKTHSNNVLNEMLSSTIDVDRLDYLLRDSHNTGVVYGNIDISRIANCVMVVDKQVVYNKKGINTLEDAICARYQMFNQVYTAKKSTGYDTLIKELYNRILFLHSNEFKFETNLRKLLPFINNNVSIESYLKLDDYSLFTIINDLCDEDDVLLRSYAKALTRSLPFVEAGEGTIELDFKGYEKSSYSESIKIYDENGNIKLLEDFSPIVRALKNEKIKVESMKFYINEDQN